MRNADDSKRAMTRHCSGVTLRQWQRCSFQAQKSCGPTKNSHLHRCWERELPKPRYPTSQCDKHSCLFSQTSVRVLIESIYGEDFNFKSSNASVLWGFSSVILGKWKLNSLKQFSFKKSSWHFYQTFNSVYNFTRIFTCWPITSLCVWFRIRRKFMCSMYLCISAVFRMQCETCIL